MAVFAHSITIFFEWHAQESEIKQQKSWSEKESQFDGQNRNGQDYIHTYFHPYYYIVVIEIKQVEEQKKWKRVAAVV
jgi:hypothetical protein